MNCHACKTLSPYKHMCKDLKPVSGVHCEDLMTKVKEQQYSEICSFILQMEDDDRVIHTTETSRFVGLAPVAST